MKIARFLTALALIALPSASFAADEPVAADLVGLVVAGFADGATVFFDIDEMSVKRIAPGKFEGLGGTDGVVATLDVVETGTPCTFDITYTRAGEVRPGRFHASRINAIVFSGGAEAGPGLKSYEVAFIGEGDILNRIAPDGTVESMGSTNTIITSVPLDDLNAAAANLQALCPAA